MWMGLLGPLALTGAVALATEDAELADKAAPEPVVYELHPDQSFLAVLVRSDRSALMSRAIGNDHVVVATGWTGTVRWDAGDPTRCQVAIDAPVQGLEVDPPGSRARLGLEGETSANNRRQIATNIWGRRQLDASSFPAMAWRATSCVPAGDRFRVTGTLTLRGVGKQIALPMTIEADGNTFSARGTFDALHTDFGFDPFTNAMGAFRNLDELSFTVDVRGTAVRDASAGP